VAADLVPLYKSHGGELQQQHKASPQWSNISGMAIENTSLLMIGNSSD
jgi:hypothetical protein